MLFIERFWKNLPRGGSSDVEIVTKFNEKQVVFPCHKRILSKTSDIFKRELSANKNSRILIKDVNPYLIFLMLSYIYDSKFEEEDWKITMDLCNLAISYEITSLCEQCLRSLLSCLNLSNAHCLLELSITHSFLNPKLSILKALNSLSFQLCVKAAFHIFDSEEFNNIQPTTVTMIASHPDLNVPNEAFILHSLWIRATVDCCRNSIELTYENIARHFELYSKTIEYKDIAEYELRHCNNEFLMQYYNNVPPTGERIYPMKRQMKFPLQLPLNFFVQYYTGDIIATDTSLEEFCVEFIITEPLYLIEFSIVCCHVPYESENAVASLSIENGNRILFKWNRSEHNSNVKLKVQKKDVFTSDKEISLQMFQFVLNNLVKFWISADYKLKVKTSNKIPSWPEFKSQNTSNCPMQIKSNAHKSLKAITFLPCPSFKL